MTNSSELPQEQKTPVSVSDSYDSATLRIPAKNQEKYQQWYENEQHHDDEHKYKRLLWSLLKDRNSPALSGFILVAISFLAIILGVLAIHYLPYLSQSKSRYYPAAWRLNSYKRIPADKIGFEMQYAVSVPFELPRCFCIDSSGRICIGGDTKIVAVDSEGEKLWSYNLENEPKVLLIPETGQVFANCLIVGYNDSMEVFRATEEGYFEPVPFFAWKLPGGTPFLRSIISTDDSLYLADAGEKLAYRLDEKGHILGMIKNENEAEIENPGQESEQVFSGFGKLNLQNLSVVISPVDQLLYITNPARHRIEAFTKDAVWKKESIWGTQSDYFDGFCGISNPSGLAVMKNGNFVTAEMFIPRVKMFDPNGNFLTVVAATDDLEKPPLNVKNIPKGAEIKQRTQIGDENPIQIAITPEQNIAVLDPTYRVLRFYAEKEK